LDDALLFRTLATLRVDAPVFESIDELHWRGPTEAFGEHCRRMNAPALLERAQRATGKK
jgi:hypothetical protein